MPTPGNLRPAGMLSDCSQIHAQQYHKHGQDSSVINTVYFLKDIIYKCTCQYTLVEDTLYITKTICKNMNAIYAASWNELNKI